jgi:hypothetical protein
VQRSDRGRTGLVATIGPVAVGVMLAFGWNLAMSQPRHAAEDESAVTPRVGQTVQQATVQQATVQQATVQQATVQAWARASHAPEGGSGGRRGTRPARSG